MIETRIEETTSNPSLGMKKVHKSTLSVSGSGSTSLVANSTYMIHFSLDIPTNNYDSVYKIKLRFRQLNTNIYDAYLYDSTDAYITTGWYKKFDYRQIGSVVYREIDLTGYFKHCTGQTKYFSIKCDSELSLYTDSASEGYKPELVVEKIQSNDLLKHQVVLDGGVGDDQYKVNIRSGKLFYNKHLIGIKTTKSEISLGISYNIENRRLTTLGTSINTGLGKGFKFNYQQYVYPSGSNYIYIDSEYIYHTYTLANNLNSSSSKKVYYDVSGNYSVLEILSNGYKITSGNKVLTFNSTGLLTQISIQIDSDTSYVETITYDSSNRISKVTSGSSSLGFTYNSGNVVVTASDSRKVTIYIDSNTLISSITNVNGINTGYNYEEVGMLARAAIDMKQYFLNTITEGKKKVVFTYTENNKVLSIINYYNNNKIFVDKIEYFGKQSIVTNTQCVNGTEYSTLAIKKAYNFSELGYLESSFEIINNKVCNVKYYTYKVDEDEVISLSTGNEYYSTANVTLTPGQTYNVTDLQHFTAGEHILSVACKINKTGAYNTATPYSLFAEVYVDDVKKGEIRFKYDFTEYQVGYVKLNLNWTGEEHDLNSKVVVKLADNLDNHNIEFMSICLSAKQANNMKTCVNISNGTAVTNYDNNNLYKTSISQFLIGSTPISNIKMSFNDIVENQRLLSLGTTHNLWYNDGENMYYGVSNVSLSNIQNTKELGAVLNAKVSMTLVPKDDDTKVIFETINLIKYDGTNSKQITENRYQGYENSNTSQVVTYDKYFKVLTEQENNIIKTYNYNSDGNVSSIITSANGKSMSTSYSYNSYGDVTNESNNGVTTSYTYNNLRNITDVKRGNDTLKTISYKSDLQTISSVKTTVGSTQLTNTFNYNSYLEPTGYTGSEGTYTYEYDTYGQLSGVKLDGTTILSYQYSVSSPNVIIQVTNRAGEVTKQTLDKYGRTISITEGSTVVSTFEYSDRQGLVSGESRLRSKKINSGTSDSTIYTYDYNGNLSMIHDYYNTISYTKRNYMTLSTEDISQVLNVNINSIVDGNNLNTNTKINEEIIKCLLEDNKNQQTTYITTYSKNNINHTITGQINQDDLKRINSEYIDNFSRKFEYKTNGSYTTPFVSKETFKKGNVILGEASYGYTNGLITSITKDGYTITYQYDKLNRIVSEYNPKLGIDRTFTYDEKGNLLITGKNMTYSGQKLTKFNGQTLTYDSYNRLSKYGNINITFEKDRLKVYNNINFSYDGEGKRIQKSSSSKTHKYYYDGNRLFKESITEGSTTKNIYYIHGAKGVIGFIYDDAKYYYNRNILGDVVSILNSDEVIVASYEYDAWGNHNVYDTNGALDTSASSIGNINPIRYRGYYYDKETGLFWCNSRYYNPEWGRWISPDSIEYLDPSSINGLNLYCYCMNNPIMYVDSSGHFPVAIEVINTIFDGAVSLYEFGLQSSLKYFKNMPDITMDVAKKMARKGGHIQSARQIMRHKQNLINSTQQSLDDVVKFGEKMGKVLLVADIAWSLGENILSGEESWFTDTLVDASVSLAIYGLSFLPGGFFIALAATVATSIWEDEIEEFKDDFYEGWSNFWSFSWT